ncbi:hypothetical protein [Lutimonas sp.]|uniref:hypothetical protein n=1 Tax=Lutimonas sp. TaxID=1872403 RepID=UPI003D9ABBAA
MIRFVVAKDIDRIKYDRCINNSIGHRIYATSWYLDCTCDRWDLIVKGDYEVVMPLPNRKKYGIPYVYMPAWIQQLGLFSSEEITEDLIDSFIATIPRKIQWIDYQFNSMNKFSGNNISFRKNYLLPMDEAFEAIIQKSNKNRKRIFKKGFGDCVLDKQGDSEVFLTHYKTMQKSFSLSNTAIDNLRNLCESKNRHVQVWNVFKEGAFVGGLIWLKDMHRITYLVPFADELGKKMDIPSYIIYELIQEFQQQKLVLDFEGSMLPGVEKFYQSFGAEPEVYSYFRKRPF